MPSIFNFPVVSPKLRFGFSSALIFISPPSNFSVLMIPCIAIVLLDAFSICIHGAYTPFPPFKIVFLVPVNTILNFPFPEVELLE